MPASCFHIGSARLRFNGLPVRTAIPSRIPTTHQLYQRTANHDKPRPACFITATHLLDTEVALPQLASGEDVNVPKESVVQTS